MIKIQKKSLQKKIKALFLAVFITAVIFTLETLLFKYLSIYVTSLLFLIAILLAVFLRGFNYSKSLFNSRQIFTNIIGNVLIVLIMFFITSVVNARFALPLIGITCVFGLLSYFGNIIYFMLIVRNAFNIRMKTGVFNDKVHAKYIYHSNTMGWLQSTFTFLGIILVGVFSYGNANIDISYKIMSFLYYFVFTNISLFGTYISYIYKLNADLYNI